MFPLFALGLVSSKLVQSYRRRRVAALSLQPQGTSQYVSFTTDKDSYDDCIVVDCTHPVAQTLSHHKGHSNVAGVVASDTSTGIVVNALLTDPSSELAAAMKKPYITVNHFDIDAVLSVWSWINRARSLHYERVLRCAARIGDFREVLLPELYSSNCAPAEAVADGVQYDQDTVLRALMLCCWLNTQETSLFSAPYECKDGDEKFEYFLGNLGHALEWFGFTTVPPRHCILAEGGSAKRAGGDNGRQCISDSSWLPEYIEVLTGLELIQRSGSVTRHDDCGVVVVHCPRPVHYYSLFSYTTGCDVVVAIYDDQKYEVECKYTQYINYTSRPVWPRLDMGPLAEVLNEMERASGTTSTWKCSRLNDSGPILRLEAAKAPLNKRERYGHPFERRIDASMIDASTFERVVVSYFTSGLSDIAPKLGGWSWAELHDVNKTVDFNSWKAGWMAGDALQKNGGVHA